MIGIGGSLLSVGISDSAPLSSNLRRVSPVLSQGPTQTDPCSQLWGTTRPPDHQTTTTAPSTRPNHGSRAKPPIHGPESSTQNVGRAGSDERLVHQPGTIEKNGRGADCAKWDGDHGTSEIWDLPPFSGPGGSRWPTSTNPCTVGGIRGGLSVVPISRVPGWRAVESSVADVQNRGPVAHHASQG